MKRLDELHLNRCNVQVEDDVKEWYVYKAKSMGMSTSQLMSFVLSQWYEQQINANAVRLLSEIANDDELKQTNQNVYEVLSKMQKMQESDA